MNVSNDQKIQIGSVIFLIALVIISYIDPTRWWGLHHVTFLENGFSEFFLIVLVVSFIIGFRYRLKNVDIKVNTLNSSWLAYAFALLFGIIFYQFPIQDDFYGNAKTLYPYRNEIVQLLPADFFQNLFQLHFKPGQGRGGVFLLAQWLSYNGQITLQDAYRWIDALSGIGLIWMWVRLVQQNIAQLSWRLLLLITGATAPLLLVYFGHMESYGMVYFLLLAWFFVYLKYIKSPALLKSVGLIVLLIIGLRFHVFFILLIPLLGITIIQKKYPQITFFTQIKSIRNTLLYVGIPILILGIIIYFFIFQGHVMPRSLKGNFNDIERLFLPLNNTTPPEDKYNLFSLNHIFDFLNSILFWSPSLLFLLLSQLGWVKRTWKKNQPETSLLLLTLLVFISVLFVINPLLSMPMDWDLFLFPVPIAMVLLVQILSTKKEAPSGLVFTFTLGAVLYCIPVFIVSLNNTLNKKHIQSIGVHVFNTYYYHASTCLLYSLQSIDDPLLYIQQEDSLLNILIPQGTPESDPELYDLLIDRGVMELRINDDPLKARSFLLQATNFYNIKSEHLLFLFEANEQLMIKGISVSDFQKKKSLELLELGEKIAYENKKVEEGIYYVQLAQAYNPYSKDATIQLIQMHYLLGHIEQSEFWSQRLNNMQFQNLE